MSDTHAQTVSYVRETMLDQKAPPMTQQGAVKWVRENLFSGWLNIALTVISLFVIYTVLSLVLPWAFGGVWNAGSLTECREVLFAFYKDSHDGGCWAVIEDRWLQLLFGFYPPELYWRPILAFVLMFVALAPILFADKVPGQLMWFTLAYPFIATWLIWGGSFWLPILAAMGFVVAYIAYKILSKVSGPIVTNLGALAAALVWWTVAMTPISDGLSKSIGSGRFDATVASLEEQGERLPAEVAALEALSEDKAAEIAAAVEVKNGLLQTMVEIRIEEFAIDAQIEPKEDALRRLNGAEESIEKITDILAEWGGSPRDALDSLESEAEISAAEGAADLLDGLIGDVAKLLDNASVGIQENATEPSDIAETLVARAAEADASILDDVSAMVSVGTFIDPLADLQTRAAAASDATSSEEFGAIRSGILTVVAGLEADIASLKAIKDKIIETNAADLVEPQSAMVSQMAMLTALRDDATALSQETFRISSDDSEGRSFLTALQSLEEREAQLPVLQARTAELRAALPSEHRDMIAVNQLPEGSSNAERGALSEYLNARNEELNVASSIRNTYSELGRVGLEPVESRQIGGFMLALIIGLAGIVLSLPLGILLALGRQSHLFIVNKVCVAFIEIIRGIPLIVWLFTASLLLNYFLPPGTSFDLMLRVIIMVTLFASAYIAEVIRGGLAALPTGQYEGADSLGLGYWQSMQLIVLPQAMKISIPGIVNTFIGLFKDTTLVLFIGLFDPVGLAGTIRADTDWNGIYWELFIFIGLLFFIFCFSMGRYSLHLEKKLQREHR